MASTAHTVENACRVVRADLAARQEDSKTLRERCERAFAYCDDREHRADAAALEVWCGAVGVTLDSTLAQRTVIGGRRFPKIVAGPAAGKRCFV